jgi:DNA invertase Pin-like site-specific DNA recombinase
MPSHLAYKRVSSVEQNTQRQLSDSPIDFHRVYEDKCSGASTDRPALQKLRLEARRGDVIHVHSIDRMARSLMDLNELLNEFRDKGVSVRFAKEGLEFKDEDNHTSMLMLNIMASVAEFERNIIRERQAEGIAKAKIRGVYKGGKRKADRTKVLNMINEGVSKAQIARTLGLSRTTVYKITSENAHS